MIPKHDQIRQRTDEFIEAHKFKPELFPTIYISFDEGAAFMLSQIAATDDASQRLSDNYSHLKVKHWDLKCQIFYLKEDMKKQLKEAEAIKGSTLDLMMWVGENYYLRDGRWYARNGLIKYPGLSTEELYLKYPK